MGRTAAKSEKRSRVAKRHRALVRPTKTRGQVDRNAWEANQICVR